MEILNLKASAKISGSYDVTYLVELPVGYEDCKFISFPPDNYSNLDMDIVTFGPITPIDGKFVIKYKLDISIKSVGNLKKFADDDYVVSLIVIEPDLEDYQMESYDE